MLYTSKRAIMLAVFGLFAVVSNANATIINIDATLHQSSAPLSVEFDAGTYNVAVVDTSTAGALYTAWNAFCQVGGPPTPANECLDPLQGWRSSYSIAFMDSPTLSIGPGDSYGTQALAFSNAIATSFSLTSTQFVDFYIPDTNLGDNAGGVSLMISVPEPATAALLAFGLFGARFARKSRTH
jgi:hypothetical protein